MFDLTGRVALVTGGNRGIGLGMAAGLASAGAAVVLAARDEQRSADAVARIAAAGGAASSVACDLRERGAADAAVAAAVAAHGRLDVLVANAGIARSAPPETMTDADWDEVLDVNLSAVFRCCRAAHPHLRDAPGGGRVITVASEYSRFGPPRIASYAASKGGVVQLTKSLAVAWAPDRIGVNAILPGWFWTDLTAGLRDDARAAARERIVDRTPYGRIAEPDELAGAAVFLASAASSFVTGQTLVVDGGYSIA
jgi:2-deoxy-D-gluconate 3-dehydrogenase